MRRTALRCLLVLAALTVMLQARVESTRWWWTPDAVAALRLTPDQSRALDRLYEGTLPERRRLAERIVALADRVQQLNDSDAADTDLMPATERLVHAQEQRCELRVGFVAGAERILSPAQRRTFHRLLAQHAIGTQ